MNLKLLSLASLLALALATAQDTIPAEIEKLPQCALSCLSSAIQKSGCAQTNYTCQCTTGRAVITSVAVPCIAAGCDANDVITATSVAQQICVLAGASSTTSTSTAASSTVSSQSSVVSSASSSAASASSASASATATAAGNAAARMQAGGVLGGVAAILALAL